MYVTPVATVSFPMGDASGAKGDQLSARYGWQWVPLDIGLGAKVLDPLYIGAYLDLGVGSEGSDSKTEGRCEAGDGVEDDMSCSSVTMHAGFEAQYAFSPAKSMSGWVGYGAGINMGSQSISDAGRYSETTTASGVDYARVSGGLSLRLTKGFGLSPFGMVTIGEYLHTRTQIHNITKFSGAIDDKALHAWLTLGLRVVIFP